MFQFSERHIEEYDALGYTVFQGIIAPSLIDDLRRECERAVPQTRARLGPMAQRFQPVSAYDIDLKPFEAYSALPEVRDAVSRVLGFEVQMSGVDVLGALIEPAEQPWCTMWHRDWRDNKEGLDVELWQSRMGERDMFNQINCALYEDSCTWVVPGSHLRADTPEETARFPTRPIPMPSMEGLSNAERERACLEYCQSMPNAKRLFLDAGDYCLYRNTLWHLGNYIPYRKRATLHDAVMSPAFNEWWHEAPKMIDERRAQGISWWQPVAA